MAAVKSITGKIIDQVEKFIGFLVIDAACFRATVNELFTHLFHDGRDLFAHGAAQVIGLGHGKSGQGDRDLHDLFLINDDPVGFFEDRLELGMVIFDLDLAAFAADEIIEHAAAHRTRTIQGQNGDDIFEFRRLGFFKKFAHPRAFQLEHAETVGLRQQGVGFGIVERDTADVNCNAVDLFDQFDRLADDRQCP